MAPLSLGLTWDHSTNQFEYQETGIWDLIVSDPAETHKAKKLSFEQQGIPVSQMAYVVKPVFGDIRVSFIMDEIGGEYERISDYRR